MKEAIFHTQTKSKIFIVLAAVTAISLVVGLNLSGTKADAAVGGPSCTVKAVGGDYSTIQAALADSGCATIKVAAGDYPENVVINRSVKIKGAQAGNNVKFRTFDTANESTVTGTAADSPAFTVNAANVVIDGFSVSNVNHTLGIIVKTAGKDAKIRNNIVQGVGNTSLDAPTVGVYLENGPDGVNVVANRISNIQSFRSAQGVLIGDSSATDPSLDTVVDSNLISDITSAVRGAYGVQANNKRYTEVKIRANTIKNLVGGTGVVCPPKNDASIPTQCGWVHAIGLEGQTPNAVVRYNVISSLTSTGSDKIGVYFEDNQFFFTSTVNRNSLDVGATGFGIAVNNNLVTSYPSLSVDGECNYWGTSNGAHGVLGATATGTGSLVGPGVDSDPWLKSANLDGRCGDKWGHDNDGDNHHGDFDCSYDDHRDWKYSD